MGVMDKLMFWKKDDYDFGKGDIGSEIDNMGIGNDPFAPKQQQPYGSQDHLGLGQDKTSGLAGTEHLDSGFDRSSAEKGVEIRGYGHESVKPDLDETPLKSRPLYPQSAPSPDRDMQLILSRLDTIKALLDNMNQRLEALERNQGKSGRVQW